MHIRDITVLLGFGLAALSISATGFLMFAYPERYTAMIDGYYIKRMFLKKGFGAEVFALDLSTFGICIISYELCGPL